jgi:hypothetical protein
MERSGTLGNALGRHVSPLAIVIRLQQFGGDYAEHLYLPWSVIAELVAAVDAQLSKAKSKRPRVPVASAEALDSGCVLYQLTAFAVGVTRLPERSRFRQEVEPWGRL